MGYTIMAMNFIKLDPKVTENQIEGFRHAHPDTMGKDPFGVVLIHRGIGMGYDSVIVSFHQNYASYYTFRNHVKRMMGESITEMNAFLISLEKITLCSQPFPFSPAKF